MAPIWPTMAPTWPKMALRWAIPSLLLLPFTIAVIGSVPLATAIIGSEHPLRQEQQQEGERGEGRGREIERLDES